MSFGFLRLIGAYFIFVGRGILSEKHIKTSFRAARF
jgi:hypothetical protein|tara:strand:+ start:4065 stop:4172 length:108 start_codon:yes stop_codon:yes gene_type:complete